MKSQLRRVKNGAGGSGHASTPCAAYDRAMELDTDRILMFAELSLDAQAMSDAALAGDLDEARFRARLIVAKARENGFLPVAETAEDIAVLLRDPGMEPMPGYGHAMLRLAKLLTP